jgi:hypothetical protein
MRKKRYVPLNPLTRVYAFDVDAGKRGRRGWKVADRRGVTGRFGFCIPQRFFSLVFHARLPVRAGLAVLELVNMFLVSEPHFLLSRGTFHLRLITSRVRLCPMDDGGIIIGAYTHACSFACGFRYANTSRGA